MDRVKGGEKTNSNEGVVFACAAEAVNSPSLCGVWIKAGGEKVYDNAVVSSFASLQSFCGDVWEKASAGASGDDDSFKGLLIVDVVGDNALLSDSAGELKLEGWSLVRSRVSD